MAPLLPLLLLLLLLASLVDAFPASCSSGTCGDQAVHYPFWLLNSSASDNCGYPGLGLACEDYGKLILPVYSHRYRVFSINYTTQTIGVSDTDVEGYGDDCPRLHANLTIDRTSSWLQFAPSDTNITFFYNCSKNVSWSSAVELKGCQESDGKRSYVLPDAGITGAQAYEHECEEVVVAPVLEVHKAGMVGASGGSPPLTNPFVVMVTAGFELMYKKHSQQCDGCEGSGGWCGYQRNESTSSGLRFTCFCDDGPTTDRCSTYSSSSSPRYFSLVFSCLWLVI